MSDLPPHATGGGDARSEGLPEGLVVALLHAMPQEGPPPELRARVLASMAAAAGARRVVVAAPVDARTAGWRGRRLPEIVAGVAAAVAVVAAMPPAARDPEAAGAPGGEAVATAAASDVEQALLLLEARRSRLLASGIGAPAAERGPGGRAPL